MTESQRSQGSMNLEYLIKLAPVLAAIRHYHQHSSVGLNLIPPGGSIIATNHSLASYDISLLMASIYEHTQRIPRALIDRLFFKVPGLGSLMESLGSLEGRKESAIKILKDNNILIVAPGGMREALRPTRERYQILWDKRKGFARIAIEAQVPVLLAACPAADGLYEIAPSHVTAWAYKTFKVPLFFARGLGSTPLPKPVKLTHYLSEPILPPPFTVGIEDLEALTNKFHQSLTIRMQHLMDEAVQKEHLK